ncbi:signal peptidase I [Enterococcus faecalis 06-MB-DW-09]|nr:signal peptidase I [Enterococcus faecalis 06-MB-DW-09]
MDSKNYYRKKYLIVMRLCGAIVLIVGVFYFFRSYQVAQVYGSSMAPTLEHQQLVLIHKKQSPERYDLAVFSNENKLLIKRVIGRPGDSYIRSGNRLLLGGFDSIDEFSYTITLSEAIASSLPLQGTIPDHQYFVIGDAINNSKDSRTFGFVNIDDFIGSIKPLFP